MAFFFYTVYIVIVKASEKKYYLSGQPFNLCKNDTLTLPLHSLQLLV